MLGTSADIRGWTNSALADLDNALDQAKRRAEESAHKEDMATVVRLQVARDALVRAQDSVREEADQH